MYFIGKSCGSCIEIETCPVVFIGADFSACVVGACVVSACVVGACVVSACVVGTCVVRWFIVRALVKDDDVRTLSVDSSLQTFGDRKLC